MRWNLRRSAVTLAASAALLAPALAGTAAAQEPTDDSSTSGSNSLSSVRGSVADPAKDLSGAPGQSLSARQSALSTQVAERMLTDARPSSTPTQAMTALASEGRTPHVNINRADAAWAEGVSTIPAPAVEEASPEGWLWFAKREGGTWKVALEGDPQFAAYAASSPTLTAAERKVFVAYATPRSAPAATSGTTMGTTASNLTGLQLPFKMGTGAVVSNMGHDWANNASGTYSSLDIYTAAGPSRVRSAGAGVARPMCSNGGYARVIHSNGYSTDYYHLASDRMINGNVAKNQELGYQGTTLCAGGFTTGYHVHFALREYDANLNGWYVSLNYKVIGGYTFRTRNNAGVNLGQGKGYAVNRQSGWVGYSGSTLINYPN